MQINNQDKDSKHQTKMEIYILNLIYQILKTKTKITAKQQIELQNHHSNLHLNEKMLKSISIMILTIIIKKDTSSVNAN